MSKTNEEKIEDAQRLLMMFINDGYSQTGKVSKSTAIAMMKFVRENPDLQKIVNSGVRSDILSFRLNGKTDGVKHEQNNKILTGSLEIV